MQSISPEIPIFFNNMYYGNVPLQQYYLASFFYPYLYNSYWVPIHPNFHPPNTAAHYCDENQSSKTTKMPVHIDAGPPKRVKQPFGPEGANIYISHLPRFVDDEYLRSLFEPYGRVLSTKVNIDNRTGESKGIGFVSYDSREAAQRAIGAMNGHKIDGKRLRVQLKRSKGRLNLRCYTLI
nr:CUGBP Elav family [Hymenolepis microstoma]